MYFEWRKGFIHVLTVKKIQATCWQYLLGYWHPPPYLTWSSYACYNSLETFMLYYEEHAYTLDAESISCLKMHRPPKFCAKPRPLEAEAGVLGGRSDLETKMGGHGLEWSARFRQKPRKTDHLTLHLWQFTSLFARYRRASLPYQIPGPVHITTMLGIISRVCPARFFLGLSFRHQK